MSHLQAGDAADPEACFAALPALCAKQLVHEAGLEKPRFFLKNQSSVFFWFFGFFGFFGFFVGLFGWVFYCQPCHEDPALVADLLGVMLYAENRCDTARWFSLRYRVQPSGSVSGTESSPVVQPQVQSPAQWFSLR